MEFYWAILSIIRVSIHSIPHLIMAITHSKLRKFGIGVLDKSMSGVPMFITCRKFVEQILTIESFRSQ